MYNDGCMYICIYIYLILYCNKPSAGWPATCLEGNRKDCNILGNQTSGKEGGVQCVMVVVCMYVCMYIYILNIVYI